MKSQWRNLGITSLEQIVRVGIQLLNAFIVARLVAPESFGWSAIALLLTSGFTVFTQIGTEPYIISERKIDERTINKIWTLGIVINAIGAFLLINTAIFIFQSTNARIVLIGTSFSILFWSIGTTSRALINRENRFRELMFIGIVSSLSNLIVSVSVAQISNLGALALIVGQVLAILTSSCLSIRMSRHKLKLVMPNKFEKSTLEFYRNNSLSSLSNFVARNLDTVYLAMSLGVLMLAYYDRAYSLIYNSQIALSQVFSRVILPKYAQDENAIKRDYLRDLRAYAYISIGVYAPLILWPELVTRTIYGDGYGETAKVLPFLAIAGILQSLSSLSGLVFLALKQTGRQLRLMVVSLFVYFGSFTYVFIFNPTLMNYAKASIFASSVMVFIVVLYLRFLSLHFSIASQIKVLAFPIFAVVIFALFV